MKVRDKVVRIDSKLLRDLEEFIKLEENKYKYVNRKHFIDLAVSEHLKKEKKGLKNGK